VENIDRNIDISSQLARHTLKYKVSATQTSSVFQLAVESSWVEKIAVFEVTDEKGNNLEVKKGDTKEGKPSYTLYGVKLAKPAEKGSTFDLTVKLVFVHSMKPFPALIAVNEKQKVKYEDNVYVFTPYPSAQQKTVIKLASSSVESKTEKAPTNLQGDTLTYGPYNNVPASSYSQMTVHFEHPKNFLSMTQMTKEVEISHWGNVAEEITVQDLVHNGAGLKQPFSRYEYTRNPKGYNTVVNFMTQRFPDGAADVYYRDEIGNISTSFLSYPDNEKPKFEFRPRFPLVGEWKIGYYFGYNLPAEKYLGVADNGLYVLSVPFSHDLEEVIIDHFTLRVIFPEGSSNIHYEAPFPIDKESFETHHTYLDTFGRPVLVLEKKNVIHDHNQNIKVAYQFSGITLLREPLLLVIGIFFLFSLAMLSTRVEFSIGKKKQRSEAEEQAAESASEYLDLMTERESLRATLDKALDRFKSNPVPSDYDREKKPIDISLTAVDRKLRKLISELDKIDPQTTSKLRELESRDKKVLDAQKSLHANEIGFGSKKIPKAMYEKSAKELQSLYEKCTSEYQSLFSELRDKF